MGYGVELISREQYEDWLRSIPEGVCPLCKYKIYQRILYEGKYWLWIACRAPYWKYHTMLIPKEHYKEINELNPIELGELIEIYTIAVNKYRDTHIRIADKIINRLLFYWRLRDEAIEKSSNIKRLEHLHIHLVPEMDKLFDSILDGEAHLWKPELLDINSGNVEKFQKIRKPKKELAKEDFELARYEDITNWGWTDKELLDRLIELDKEIPCLLNNQKLEGNCFQWMSIFSEHPETWAIFVSKNRHEVVGYWHFVILPDDMFARAKRGELLESEITNENTCYLNTPGNYHLYFVMIIIKNRYKGYFFLRLLIKSFLDQLTDLANNGIFFDEICANALTEEGKQLSIAYGLKPIKEHADTGYIFSAELQPDLKLFEHHQQLRELYLKKEEKIIESKKLF